jgi:hypothetical protein
LKSQPLNGIFYAVVDTYLATESHNIVALFLDKAQANAFRQDKPSYFIVEEIVVENNLVY